MRGKKNKTRLLLVLLLVFQLLFCIFIIFLYILYIFFLYIDIQIFIEKFYIPIFIRFRIYEVDDNQSRRKREIKIEFKSIRIQIESNLGAHTHVV